MPSLPASLRRQLAAIAKATQKLSVPRASKTPNLKKARNIFLIRSAAPEMFKKCVRELKRLAPKATLHIVSHERDRELIKTVCAPRFKFYPYTAGGNYSVESLAPLMPKLNAARIDTFIMLANNVYGYPHISEILSKLGARELFLFNINERWYVTSRDELDFKNAAANVYLGICKLLWNS